MQEEVAGYLVYSTLKHHGGSPVYLATPYTALVEAGEGDRAFGFALKCIDQIWRQYGILALSPIYHGHLMSKNDKERRDRDMWKPLCRQIMRECRSMVVPKTPESWPREWSREASPGIHWEMDMASAQVKPVMWLSDPL